MRPCGWPTARRGRRAGPLRDHRRPGPAWPRRRMASGTRGAAARAPVRAIAGRKTVPGSIAAAARASPLSFRGDENASRREELHLRTAQRQQRHGFKRLRIRRRRSCALFCLGRRCCLMHHTHLSTTLFSCWKHPDAVPQLIHLHRHSYSHQVISMLSRVIPKWWLVGHSNSSSGGPCLPEGHNSGHSGSTATLSSSSSRPRYAQSCNPTRG